MFSLNICYNTREIKSVITAARDEFVSRVFWVVAMMLLGGC